MSYDVFMEADMGGSEPAELGLLDENYTYNVSQMFVDVLGHSITEWDNKAASEVQIECGMILAAFIATPDKYRKMNPPNGWGTFEGATRFIQKIHDACQKAPKATVRVC